MATRRRARKPWRHSRKAGGASEAALDFASLSPLSQSSEMTRLTQLCAPGFDQIPFTEYPIRRPADVAARPHSLFSSQADVHMRLLRTTNQVSESRFATN